MASGQKHKHEFPSPKRPTGLKEDGSRWVDANVAYVQGEENAALQDDEVHAESSWEDVSFDHVKEELFKIMLEREGPSTIDDQTRAKFEEETAKMWDKFYSKHSANFFKDRRYLGREFPELNPQFPDGQLPEKPYINLLEVGCGAGNTVFPLLKTNPDKFVYCFDCSEKAVQLVKSNERYDPQRCYAFTCNFAEEDITPKHIPPECIDIVTMIFVLSALPPEKMKNALRRIYDVMKPGGLILFRDYGVYDLTQLRFSARAANKLADNYYRRSDGTFTYFFTPETLAKLFTEAGFEIEVNDYMCRVMRNRKRKIAMYRVWIQSRFRKPATKNAQASSDNQ